MRKLIVAALVAAATLTVASAANAYVLLPPVVYGPVYVPGPVYIPTCTYTVYGPICS